MNNVGNIYGEVVSVHKTGCFVNIKGHQHFCLVKSAEKPVVNDKVILKQREDKWFIMDITERKSFVARYDFYKERYQGFAANVDTAFIVTSANKEFSENRISRFLALLQGQEIRKVIVLTKTDLAPSVIEYEKSLGCFEGVEQVLINAKNASDVFKLLKFLKAGGTALLMGSSGVGKSTIINTLCGLELKTNDVQSERLGNKGKHTTSARIMYYLPDGRKIIDTPGIKIVGIEGECNSRQVTRR